MSDDSQSSSREWNSAAYHRLSGPQVSWGKRVLSRLHLRGDEVVLDAGCGTGRLTAELLEALPRGRVVGVDLSQNMLGSAREHLAAQFGERVSLVACDLLYLPFDHAFDAIVSTAAFHWVLDQDKLFANLRRALVREGWLEAQCGGGPNLVNLRKRVNELAASAKFASFFVDFCDPWLFQDAEGAAESLRRAGFVDIETSHGSGADESSIAHRNIANLSATSFCGGIWRTFPSEDLRAAFMSDLTRQAAGDHPAFSLDYWRLNLRGRASA